MNKKEFIKEYAERYKISIELSDHLCSSIFDLLSEVTKREDRVYIHRFGTFKRKLNKARNVRHPVTGEIIIIPPKSYVSFKQELEEEENTYL